MKIESVQAFPIRIENREKLVGGTFAYTHYQTVVVRAVVGGVAGWGEAMTRFDPAATSLLVRYLAKGIVGTEVDEPGRAWSKLWGDLRIRGHTRGTDVEALSGIEIALWDSLARLQKKPIYAAFSSDPATEVEVYAGSLFESRGPLEEQVAHARSRGMKGAKVKIGFGVEKDQRVLRGVRREWPEGRLIADANGAYDSMEAKRACEKFRELGLDWFEEPVPSDDWKGYSQLKGLGVKVGGGEAWFQGDLGYALDNRLVDVLEPSVSRCGGIGTVAEAARKAASMGIGFSPMTGMNSGISVAASLHLSAAFPSMGVEVNPFDNPLQREMVTGLPEAKDGAMEVPRGFGLGIEVDEGFLRRNSEPTGS